MGSRAVWCIKMFALLALIILEVMGCYQFGSLSGELFLEEAGRHHAEPFFAWIALLVSLILGACGLICGVTAGYTSVKGVWLLRREWRLIRIRSKVMRAIEQPQLRRHSEDEDFEYAAPTDAKRWVESVLKKL